MNGEFDTDEPPVGRDAPAFDPAAYPRSYRLKPLWLVLQVVASLALLAGGVALLAIARVSDPQSWQAAAALAGLCCLLIGVAGLVDARRARVVLHADAIEVHALLGCRTVQLDSIIGRQGQARGDDFITTRLQLAPGAGRSVRLPSTLDTDSAFDAWLARVTDLDLAEREASLKAIADNSALGSAPEERLRRVALINNIASLGVPVAWGLLAWSVVSSRTPVAALVAIGLLPWLILAAVAWSRGVLRLGGSAHDVRPNLLGMLTLACVALVPRLLAEVNLDNWASLVPVAMAAGAATSLLALRFSARHGPLAAQRWAIVPLFCVYCGAAGAWLNVLADHRPAKVDRTRATFKHVNAGRMLTFSLKLDPWGALRDTQTLKVSQAVFNSLSPGETVCVREHPGLWGWPWTDVAPCPQTSAGVGASSMPSTLYRALKLAAYAPERRGPRLGLLLAERYAELDSQLSELQGRFERGEVNSEILLVTYRDFYDPDPDLDALFDGWIARLPNSYPAYLARGIHRKFQAERLHGAGFERWVSPDLNVEAYADGQLDDLKRSTRLTSKPTMSYVHMIDAAAHRGQRDEMRALLDRGLEAEPGSFALKRKYLAMLRPMYGGSLQEMEVFVAECHQDGTTTEVLNTLDAMLLTQRGWAIQREGHEEAALALFRQAAALNPFGDELNTALLQEADILSRRKQFDAAVAVLRRAVQAKPDEARTHGMLGYSLHWAGRKPEAIDEYKRAAELGDSWSQSYLGQLYLHGDGVERDTEQAARWLNAAAAGGNNDAKQALREHPELSAR